MQVNGLTGSDKATNCCPVILTHVWSITCLVLFLFSTLTPFLPPPPHCSLQGTLLRALAVHICTATTPAERALNVSVWVMTVAEGLPSGRFNWKRSCDALVVNRQQREIKKQEKIIPQSNLPPAKSRPYIVESLCHVCFFTTSVSSEVVNME